MNLKEQSYYIKLYPMDCYIGWPFFEDEEEAIHIPQPSVRLLPLLYRR